jgi:hypothetical protein
MAAAANHFAEWFAVIAVIAVILAHLAGFMEGVLITLIAAGALSIGGAVGYVYVRWVLPAQRMRRLGITAGPSWATLPRPSQREVEPHGHAAGDRGELPEGGQHLHLHLPAGVSADEVVRLLKGDR